MAKNFVTDYSADPTGSADATAKLQTAITDVGSGGQYVGQELFIPAGTYKITGAGVNVAVSNAKIRGESRDGTILKFASGGTATASIINTATDNNSYNNIEIRDLTLDGTSSTLTSNQTGGIGISAAGGQSHKLWRLMNLCFQNFSYNGIRWATAADQWLLNRCEFTAINTGTGQPTPYSSISCISGQVTNTNITDCLFHDTGSAYHVDGYGWCIYLNGLAKNNTISGSRFVNVAGAGIELGGLGDLGSVIYGNTVTGCTFSSVAVNALETAGSVATTFTNNVFSNKSGIDIAYACTGFTVAGNTFRTDITTGGPFLNINGQRGNGFGVSVGTVANNSFMVSDPTQTSAFAPISVNGSTDIEVIGNVGCGYDVGVHLLGSATNYNQRVHVVNNKFMRPAGATSYAPSGMGYIFDPAGNRYIMGLFVDGASFDVTLEDNRLFNYDYELAFGAAANQGGAGTSNGVYFRSPSPDGTTKVAVLSGGTLPGNFYMEPRVLKASRILPPYGPFTLNP